MSVWPPRRPVSVETTAAVGFEPFAERWIPVEERLLVLIGDCVRSGINLHSRYLRNEDKVEILIKKLSQVGL